MDVGEVYGRLTVLRLFEQQKHREVEVLCECGNIKTVLMSNLKAGKTKSCGCLRKEATRQRVIKHGLSKTLEHSSWYHAIARTTDVNHPSYPNYGGRGITVCEGWKLSFETFLKDMGLCHIVGGSLDRIDNDLGYYKENCRWSSKNIQEHHKRKSKNRTSIYFGVHLDKREERTNRWVAQICRQNTRKYIGAFRTEIEAATAYDNASALLYGDRPNGTLNNNTDGGLNGNA